MNQKVFAYCERGVDPSFWAEPFNAVTNLAFLLAAAWALALWLRHRAERGALFELAMVLLVFVIGIGSFLFHTFATRWAAFADTIPIGIFMMAYMGYALRCYLRWQWWAVAAGLLIFFFALSQASMVRCDGGPCLNGSVAYVPALLAMLLIGLAVSPRKHPAAGHLIAAGLIFGVSLTFRSLDRAWCDATDVAALGPLGLHFLWHCLNAAVLFTLLRAAILFGHWRAGDNPSEHRST